MDTTSSLSLQVRYMKKVSHLDTSQQAVFLPGAHASRCDRSERSWVEPATLGAEGQRKTNYATQPAIKEFG
ncbi:hypothetical protein TNCV_1723361 [Trichonephila clavipes]|nr:hypothetical protein TNCV_1723361 [Trichonephila clavipes]